MPDFDKLAFVAAYAQSAITLDELREGLGVQVTDKADNDPDRLNTSLRAEIDALEEENEQLSEKFIADEVELLRLREEAAAERKIAKLARDEVDTLRKKVSEADLLLHAEHQRADRMHTDGWHAGYKAGKEANPWASSPHTIPDPTPIGRDCWPTRYAPGNGVPWYGTYTVNQGHGSTQE